MKRFLFSLGLISAMASAAMAETYTAPTTPMPETAIWTPTTASPGVYSELVGTYECDVTDPYIAIYGVMLASRPNGWIVNENDEIVYTGQVSTWGNGLRANNMFRMVISEENAIKEPGTYYFILPVSTDPEKPAQAQVYDGTKLVYPEIYNLKAGPYIVGEVKDPVPAEITVSPTGEFEQPEGVSYFTLTVGNADILNVANLTNDVDGYAPTLVVTGPHGQLTMEPGVREGNTIKWEFPLGDDGENTAKLEAGKYSVAVNYDNFSGFTADLSPITFPDSNVTYEFIVEGESSVVPEVTLSPNTFEFTEWTAKTIGITLSSYKFEGTLTELKENAPKLIIVNPVGDTYEPEVGIIRATNAVGYNVSGLDFSIPGEYNCYWKIAGYTGIPSADPNARVQFKDVTFTYKNTNTPKYVPEVILVTPLEVQEVVAITNMITVKVDVQVLNKISQKNYPQITVTKPSGEVFTPAGFRYQNTTPPTLNYQIDETVFAETGSYKVVMDLDGWTATVKEGNELIENVELANAEWTYEVTGVKEPVEPEIPTNPGSSIVPAPGNCAAIHGINFSFGSDFIEDFGAWTEDFNAELMVTNLSDNTVTNYKPILSNDGTTVGYDVKLSSDTPTEYKVALNLWKQVYYVATGARAAETAEVPADKAWIVANYNVDKETGIESVTLDGTNEVYFDLNGNRLSSKPAKGVYIRLSNGSPEKVLR